MPLGLIFVPAFTYLNEHCGFNVCEITISVLHRGGIWKKTTDLSPYCASVYLCSASNTSAQQLCSTPVTLRCFSLFHKGAAPLWGFACEQPVPWQPKKRMTHRSDSQREITAGSKTFHPSAHLSWVREWEGACVSQRNILPLRVRLSISFIFHIRYWRALMQIRALSDLLEG